MLHLSVHTLWMTPVFSILVYSIKKAEERGQCLRVINPAIPPKILPNPAIPIASNCFDQILIWPFAKVNEHEKFIISPYAKVYDREMQKFHKLMNLQKFLYTKVSDPISILIYSRKMTTRQSG